jgi:hypothetical protein
MYVFESSCIELRPLCWGLGFEVSSMHRSVTKMDGKGVDLQGRSRSNQLLCMIELTLKFKFFFPPKFYA